MTDPTRHDWVKIIAELGQAKPPITFHTLAKMMHRQYIQIERWSKGAEPRHYEGEMLLMIHREYVSRETEVTTVTSSTSKQPA